MVGRRRSWQLALLGLLLVAELRVGSPVPWPLPTVPVPTETVLQAHTGPFLELPRVHPLGQPGVVADENLLLQVVHGKPTSATRNNRRTAVADMPATRRIERVMRQCPPDGARQLAQAAPDLVALGYRQLVLFPARLPACARAVAAEGLGPPLAGDAQVIVFALE